jgi:glycerophosphoryl diester phosphodiesterase
MARSADAVTKRTFRLIGHRGAAALAPENTWASFDAALRVGVDAVETDVRATGDGVLVLLHDAALDRTTDGAGLVHETPWSVVRTLDAGVWLDEAFRGAQVPRLRETLARYGERTHLVLEIKQAGIAPAVLALVQESALLDRVTFTSFDFARARALKASAPEARIGFLTADVCWANALRTADAHLDQFCPPAALATEARVARWHELGLEVRVWGVETPELARSAAQAGVDGMTVDFPHLLSVVFLGARRACS